MTLTAIALLQGAAERGLKLEAHGDDLHVIPGDRVATEFAEVLKAHKPALLTLLKLPLIMIESQILQETLFFCEDDDTRGALAEAGAEPWSIYTRPELQTLCVQNGVAPLTAAELRKVHEIKRTFSGSFLIMRP